MESGRSGKLRFPCQQDERHRRGRSDLSAAFDELSYFVVGDNEPELA